MVKYWGRTFLVSATALALAACITVSNVRVDRFDPSCAFESQASCRLGIKGRWDFQQKSAVPGSGPIVEVIALLSSNAYLTVTTNRVRFMAAGGTAALKLHFIDSVVAETTIEWYRSGNRIYLANPTSVRTWLESHADAADGVTLDVNGIALQIDGADGQLASVTMSAEVGGVTVASATRTGYINTGDGGCRFAGCEVQ